MIERVDTNERNDIHGSLTVDHANVHVRATVSQFVSGGEGPLKVAWSTGQLYLWRPAAHPSEVRRSARACHNETCRGVSARQPLHSLEACAFLVHGGVDV